MLLDQSEAPTALISDVRRQLYRNGLSATLRPNLFVPLCHFMSYTLHFSTVLLLLFNALLQWFCPPLQPVQNLQPDTHLILSSAIYVI